MKQTFELHIYHTSDSHGHLTSDSYSGLKNLPKGLSRVSSFFKKQTHDHQLRIDTGDTIQGSPLAYIYKENQTDFHPFAETLNMLKYDYFVPGNHDFNYGLRYLDKMVHSLQAKTLCANVFIDKNLYFSYAYDIKSYDHGPRVAIIGITNNYIPNWEPKENIKNLYFENAFESAKRVVSEIKKNEKPDYIIVAYHGGYECNPITGKDESKNSDENLGCKIFTQIKDVDLLLTGHEHRLIEHHDQHRFIYQVGYAASHVSHTTVTFIKNEEWNIDNVEGHLVSMEDYEDDSTVIDKLSDFLYFSDQELNQIIGKAASNFLISDPLQARLNKHIVFQYINEVQMKTTGAMISCCGLGNDVTGFHETISLRDVLNTYVFPNTLYLCEIQGKDLIEALNHNAQFFKVNQHNDVAINDTYLYPKKELYNYDVFDGISYDICIYKDKKNHVQNVKYQEKPIDDHQVFTIVLNSYRMSGGGNINWHKKLKVIKAYPLDITEILINDIKSKKQIEVTYHNNIKIIKHL
ncbi:MAG: bifunctional metallophosphatase/5'-nucleotidase [Bacillota bacterium]|nr:MAG: bifunctional metallophosphatase/5'-nucleotidase [Bacillota bacterium]